MIYGELADRRIYHLEQELTDARAALTAARRDARTHQARVEAIQDALDRHPDPGCAEHPDGDVISCGWKSALRDVIHALKV